MDQHPRNEPADDLAQGIIPTAKQSIRDLFVWKQRVVVSNTHGETRCEWHEPARLANPLRLLGRLSPKAGLFFLVGWLAWTADAFDFHALSIQTVKLAAYYGRTKADISGAITLTLLLRSVGAAAFGLAGDRWGRKWPMVLNMLVLGGLQVATVHAATFARFLAVRSLFGLFMGGVYGNAMAMGLEQCPPDARGLVSGILQQGYSLGYVLAACANLGVGGAVDSWKTVFWVGAGFSFAVGLIRVALPESEHFVRAAEGGGGGGSSSRGKSSAGSFWRATRTMLAGEWRMCVYCVLLMTWFNFFSHTTQDSYTTLMLTQKQLANAAASRASILMKTGACVGGTAIGYASQFLGRRRTIVGAALASALLIPAWILPTGERALSATGFLMQFFVQGAWGVIPVHLNELAPPAYRSTFAGVTYQVGNMVSSPSAQIVNALADRTFVALPGRGKRVEAYGPVMGVATAIVAAGIVVTTMLGPERRGRAFGDAVAGAEREEREDEAEGVEDVEKRAVVVTVENK